ncbi:hypothetical protein [Virgisporangium aurantiacum]|uniref:Uncharacterized protein n=1 Tax=Virgisporangium aurantiacum TaxID=175570 RepID=A0A8J3Z2L1_9ACTN|nr:hypothetical protein [Virgisporangium aurantiacum]GIJ56114.1 hypothetical protein Vau01_036300 [Virgisporangium aurantiacum]
MGRPAADGGRSVAAAPADRAGAAIALLLPLMVALTGDLAVNTAGSVPVAVALSAAAALTAFQCGRVYVRLQNAPLYPRENYFGEADIVPELPEAPVVARRRFYVAAAAAGGTALLLATAEVVVGMRAPVAALALAVGVAVDAVRAGRLDPARREKAMRGRYVLYLRNFARARPWIVLATVLAAAPGPVLAVLSPRRTEARSPSWYLLGVLFPVQFARIRFWATGDDQWHRVVTSCMNSSRAIVYDCSGLPQTETATSGLELEIGFSAAFGGAHPTAYVTEPGLLLPAWLPVPAILQTRPTPWWLLRRFRALVGRLRAVILRRLPAAEQDYLDRFYAALGEQWTEAAIRDRNLAHREGRRDPHELLMSRDPAAASAAEIRRRETNTG